MSESLNVNVLVAAKEEYTKQLVYNLSPEIYNVIINVFRDSQKLKKKMSISLRNFQLELKRIPTWNTILIEKHTKDIKIKIPYLLNLITAIFVSHVKILACVRLKTDSKNINVKVPNLDHFLHQIIIMNAEKIYYNPDIIQKKKEYAIMIIAETIEETIRNQIPIDKILSEYLAGVFENDDSNNRVIRDKELRKFKNEESDDDGDEDEGNEEDGYNTEYVGGSSQKYINEDEDNEDSEDSKDSEDGEDDEILNSKNIIPTRPLPETQFDNTINQNDINNPDIESGFSTTEIKNRVLFSDAIEKNKERNNLNEDNSDSDSDDLGDLNLDSDDDIDG